MPLRTHYKLAGSLRTALEEAAVSAGVGVVARIVGQQRLIVLNDLLVGVGVLLDCLRIEAFEPRDFKNTSENTLGNRQLLNVLVYRCGFIEMGDARGPAVAVNVHAREQWMKVQRLVAPWVADRAFGLNRLAESRKRKPAKLFGNVLEMRIVPAALGRLCTRSAFCVLASGFCVRRTIQRSM